MRRSTSTIWSRYLIAATLESIGTQQRRPLSSNGGGAKVGVKNDVADGEHLRSREADDASVRDRDGAAPMPPNYVPVEQRDAADESLLFLRKPSAAKPTRPVLPEGCIEAPHLPDRPKREPRYIDEHAMRLKSTSVGGGRPLISNLASAREAFLFEEKPTIAQELSDPVRTFHRTTPSSSTATGEQHRRGDSGKASPQAASGVDEQKPLSAEEELGRRMAASIPRTRMDELREDLQKLDYYQGTPDYMKHYDAFRAKYGDQQKLKVTEEEGIDRRPYTEEEIALGMKGEPIDLHRASTRLQSHLTSGPHGFHPDTLMQQYGFSNMEAGYAFSPAKVIGQLDGAGLRGLDATKPDFNLASQSLKDQVTSNAHEDKSLIFRFMGINTIQRRQIRLCLSDLDTKDINASLHVMMTYPYTDWLFCFYLSTLGLVLFTLQKKYRAYDFYDEYLGLDLRQVRALEKPLLLLITCGMLFVLWHPVTLASIASTRIYRIILGRPIGPP